MSFFKERSQYFKSLSNLHKLVAHDRVVGGKKRKSFFRLNDDEELVSSIESYIHFPCVTQFGFAGKYTEEKDDMPKRNILNDLLFLDKAKSLTDMDSIEDAKDRAFDVMEDFIKIMVDQFEQEGYCSNFDNISRDMFSFSEYGPVGTSLFGWRLSFNDETDPGEHDESKWFEEEF